MTLARFHDHTILSMLLLSGNTLSDFGILSAITVTEPFSIKSENKSKNYQCISCK